MRSKFRTGCFPRLGCFASLLVLALILVIAGIVYGVRATHTDYACLQVDTFVSRTLIDLRAGFRADKTVSEQRLAAAGNSVVPSISWSPDRQHVAYAESYVDPAGSAHRRLFVRPTRWAGVGDPILIELDSSTPYGWSPYPTWSPDSQYFAYLWGTDNGQNAVAVASPGGQKSVTTGKDPTYLYGWSADSAYFAFGISTGNSQQALMFWSRDARLFIDPPATMPGVETDWQKMGSLVWSPRGHQLAYLTSETGGKYRLVILTPGGSVPVTFDLPDSLWAPVLFWSPDGRYATVASLREGKTGLWRLGVFGVDGASHAGISEITSGHYPPSSLPEAQWATDGQSLVYMDTPDGDDFHARLVVFHVDSGQNQILLTGARANLFYMPDGRYMQTAWASGNRVVTGFVDVTTGVSYPLLDYDGDSGPDLWPSPDGRTVAVAPVPGSNKGLQLLATDGTWKRAISTSTRASAGAPDEYSLAWSPDSSLLAVIHRVPAYSVYGLDVVRLDGTSVYHADAIASYPPFVTWTRCEAG
jgi:Tol biopolymer transport system component